MIVFIVKSAGIIALFFGIYKIFLERDTYFKVIRIYFMLGIALSIIIPFISITKYIETPQATQIIYSQNYQNLLNTTTSTPFNWIALLLIIYYVSIALSGIYFIYQIINLLKLINTKPTQYINNLKIIETTKEVSPFSFFNYIVYNPSQFTELEIKQLLIHEQTHVLQKHSIDMLLAQLLVCVQWFNPFAWWYKKAINQNLEYIADKEAKNTITPKSYSYLLIKTTRHNCQIALANNFYNSLLKKRIIMLHKSNSHWLKKLKMVLILPLLVAFIFTFNAKVEAQQKGKAKKVEAKSTEFSVTINKNSKKSDLEFAKTKFEKLGYTLKFSNIKRNTNDEITGIKISAKSTKNSAQSSIKGNNPIKPIKIEYKNTSDRIYIGNIRNSSSGNKEKSYSYSTSTSTNSNTLRLTDSLSSNSYNNHNANENVFVFKTSDGSESPLFVIDGKIAKDGLPKTFNFKSLKSIIVLKGIKAINKYGEKGKNGVVEIYN